MADPLAPCVVRMYGDRGAIVGTGFRVSDRHVLTCAHVVAQALGVPEETPDSPTGEVRLDFPLIEPGQPLAGRVVRWLPVRSDGGVTPRNGEDIAVLELIGEPPRGSQSARLVT